MNIEIGENEQKKKALQKPSVIEEIAYRDTWGKGADSFYCNDLRTSEIDARTTCRRWEYLCSL